MKFLVPLTFLLVSFLAHANLERIQSDKPLYEFGVIGGAGYIPHYPAADQGQVRVLAAPIVRYRGLRFRSDEEDSMKARLFADPQYGFDLSAGGSFAASSDKNDARKGMPDLDWTGELGPRFYWFFIKTHRLWIRMFVPVRVAFSTDLTGATYQGLVFAPAVNMRYFFDESKFNSVFLGVVRTHTTHQLQEYFYEVKDRYQTTERNSYQAVSGYMSTSASVAFLHEKDSKGFYAGVGVSSFKGAANSGSPLHRTDMNYSGFFGFTYTFFKSREMGFQ